MPLVARLGGPDGWSSIAVAQAIGMFCGVITSFGSNVAGAAHIALAESAIDKLNVYTLSFWSRLPIFIATITAGTVVSWVLSAPGHELDSALMCIGMGIAGLSMAWYGIGSGSPTLLILFEAVPRVGFVIVCIPLMLITGQIFLYPLAVILGTVLGLVLLHRRLFGRMCPLFPGFRSIGGALSRNAKHAAIDGAGSVYVSAPLPLVGSMAGTIQTASFASSNQLFRYGLFVIVAASNTLQSWVLTPGSKSKAYKHLTAILIHLGIGGCGFLVLYAGGDFLTGILFGPELAGQQTVLFWYGVAYFSVSVSTPLIRNILIPGGRAGSILLTINIAAVVGLAGMLVLGKALGPVGVAASYAASETLVMLVLAIPAYTALKRSSASEASKLRGLSQSVRNNAHPARGA